MKNLKSKQLLDAMTFIDEKYIDAFNAETAKRRKMYIRKQIQTVAGIAACVCIAVGGIMLGAHFYRQSTINPPITAGPQTDGSQTATEILPTEDFVIENGRLIAYNGAETEIVIPDDVTEITASAFNESAVAKRITSIHVSSSVSRIDEKAFSELDLLGSISVDKANTSYISKDGVLGSTDGTVYFSAVLTPEEASYKLPEIIIELHSNTDNYGRTASIMIGRGVLKIKFEPHETYAICYLTSIGAFGQEKILNTPLAEWGINTSQTDDTYVISLYSAEGEESTWIFTKDGICEISHADESESGFHTKFRLCYGDKEINFEGKQINWQNSRFYFEDLNGDRTPELTAVFVWGTGTGVHAEDVHIFDSVTLEEYAVEDLSKTLPEHVSFTSDGESYTITASDGTHRIDKSKLDTPKENLARNVMTGMNYRYEVINGRLHYTTACTVGMAEICGEIDVTMTYTDDGFVCGTSVYKKPAVIAPSKGQSPDGQTAKMDLDSYMSYFVNYFHAPYKATDRIDDEDILTLIFQFYFCNKDNPGLFAVYDGSLSISVNGDELRKTAKLLLGEDFEASEYHDFFKTSVEDYSEELDTYSFGTAKDYWGGDLCFIDRDAGVEITETDDMATVIASVYQVPCVPCDPSEYVPLGKLKYTFEKVTDGGFTYYRIMEITAVK